jgi:hypothetical protein
VRLIQIVGSVGKEASGPTYLLVRLCASLLAQGHEVTLALVEALSKAMSLSPAELAQTGRVGRDWMARDFSWARIAADMPETYAWLSGGGQVPACVRLN